MSCRSWFSLGITVAPRDPLPLHGHTQLVTIVSRVRSSPIRLSLPPTPFRDIVGELKRHLNFDKIFFSFFFSLFENETFSGMIFLLFFSLSYPFS